jgi:protein involved in polysaccharide export with SLBB domain
VIRLVLICLLAVVTAAGCGGSGAKPQTGLNTADPGEEGTWEDVWLPEATPYRMTVGDALTIKFFYYPLYDFSTLVRPDGMVSIPLMGEVKAAGMKPSDLEKMIRDRYTEIVAEPEVSVLVTEFGNQRVFVFGEVQVPGPYPLVGNMTVLDALVAAGGPKDAAHNSDVVLMRKSPDGRYVARTVDIEAKIRGRDDEIVYLAPSDIVYVPLSAIGKLDRFVDQFFNKLSPAWRFYIMGRDVVDPERQTIISQ